MGTEMCVSCHKAITDQEYTTLVCHATGRAISHTSHAHPKCWDKFKKSCAHGRGVATANRAQNLSCPVADCHNALEHVVARKKDGQVERRSAVVDGAPSPNGVATKGTRERRNRREACEEDEEEEDDEDRCVCFKADGTRCMRNVFDADLGACKLHVETARKQREHARRLADDTLEKERQAEVERELNGEKVAHPSPLPPGIITRKSGINMDIPDGPVVVRPVSTLDTMPPITSEVIEPAEPVKPARWKAAERGLNQRKARQLDEKAKAQLDDCPICYQEKADIRMKPCGHDVCGSCLDQWMSQRSSFAQTLRNGNSETTCPFCRTSVQETMVAVGEDEENGGLSADFPPWTAPGIGLSPSASARAPASSASSNSRRSASGALEETGSSSTAAWPGSVRNGANATMLWAENSLPPFFRGGRPDEALPLEALEEHLPGERISCTSDSIEARLEAVMNDEPDTELCGVRDEAVLRQKELEEARAHAAWMKAQASTGSPSPNTSQAASEASTALAPTQHTSPPSPVDEQFGVTRKPAEGWNYLSGGGAFGVPWAGGAFPAATFTPGGSATGAHDTHIEPQLRAEVNALREELCTMQRYAGEHQRRAEKAEAEARRLEEQLAILMVEVHSERAARVASENANRQLQADFKQLSSSHESVSTRVRSICTQLQAREMEVEELRAELQRHMQRPSAAHAGSAVAGIAPGTRAVSFADSVRASESRQTSNTWNSYPSGSSAAACAPSQLAPAACASPVAPNSQGSAPQLSQRQGAKAPMPVVAPGPAPSASVSGVPHGGQQGSSSALPAPVSSWKCAHCTYLNQSPAILDPQSKNYKGFCEICEGVTTLA
ncbi:hypothetical protein AB1Y20_009464 [Prymnesium parvum]|uniref:RING-type domain-containing protein n=1 Tax=Prymnesium parvum TaxID=97485 RepID=A0AB34K6K2_PRYPA